MSGRHSGGPAAPRRGREALTAVAMQAAKAFRPIHSVAVVVPAQHRDVDGMGADFVGNPPSAPGSSLQDRVGTAPATTAADLAEPTPGGRGE